jgi:hypothetical protein
MTAKGHLLKNSKIPVSFTLANKWSSQIAPGSTISHARRGKAPPKQWIFDQVESFSTELTHSRSTGIQMAFPIPALITANRPLKLRIAQG